MVDENIRTVKGMSYLLKKKPQKLKSSYIRLYLRFIFEEKKGLCLNICYAYTTKQNNVKVKDDGWF